MNRIKQKLKILLKNMSRLLIVVDPQNLEWPDLIVRKSNRHLLKSNQTIEFFEAKLSERSKSVFSC